jgi:hypothetical protein
MGFLKSLKSRLNDKACYSFRSKSGDALLSICGDLGAARFTTKYTSVLVDATDGDFGTALSPAFAEAYRKANDAGDEKLAAEIHALRHIICH